MKITNIQFYKSFKSFLLLVFVFCSVISVQAQEIAQDSVKTGYDVGELKTPNPNSVESKYTFDPTTNRYIYTETVGDYNINFPIILTPKEYYALVAKENTRAYYKKKIDAFDGKKEGAEEARKNLLPEFYVNSELFETVFGGNTIEIIPQGSVEIDLGVLYSKQDNPTLSPRNRSNTTFDFDQRISLSLVGEIGEYLQINANYDTQSTFDFQNLIKLEYTPNEDNIIQKLEVGNVSMPLNSSLITGAQSLFGVKAELQFGKTTVTGVFSEQKSQSNTVVAEGGGTLEEFDVYIRDYDENRHFFLSQYFRDTYDATLANYPFINNKGLQITRIEVWVTNRNNNIENVRDIVAFQDLGESSVIGLQTPPAGFVNVSPGSFPDNGNNEFDPTNIGGSGSQLTEAVRDIATVQQGILVPNVSEGADYSKLENARKLIVNQEYTVNSELGYISLNQRLNNDEILAVAFQFTVGGKVYQVGEFANDGVNATDVTTDINGDVTSVVNSAIILKMLKSSVMNVKQPVWDLMMKNIYDTGAYNLTEADLKLNIFYNEASPLNYIKPVGATFPLDINGNPVTSSTDDDDLIENTPLLNVFNLDRLNYNNDPQTGGDGFFDFVSGITVMPQNGKIVFTSAEPFGEYLFNILGGGDYDDNLSYNDDQLKYVYDVLYRSTKAEALETAEKNKFKLKGRYKSSGGDGIPIGAFNIPRGSVRVSAGGRLLVEGIDYTVNYQLGRVQILDEALKASNTPIEVSTENNAVFGQQTKRFTGFNVEHKFNENFIMNGTFLNLNERPVTQKANYGHEPINNSIFGINGNYGTEVPFLTRLVNKLPNIDTDVESNLSIRGEFAYLVPGASKGTDIDGQTTAYIDDFEGSQNGIDLKSQLSWFLSSRPLELNVPSNPNEDANGIQNGYQRAMLNWYSIDPIFYSSQRPDDISDEDVSGLYTSRVFINELFPDQDLVQGQNTILFTLDLAYYPEERGPYNFDQNAANGIISNPQDSWAGITRQLNSTDFEQQNVEYIDFWLQDPFQENPTNPGGKLVFNLGNISEDVIKDGRKLYENGLPKDGDISTLQPTDWGTVVPLNQSLVYAFDSTGEERVNQDAGYDGYSDADEAAVFGSNFGEDPANDNYTYFLDTTGDIFERYKKYNGSQGNTPDTFSDTNRGANTQPDVEDINRDNTMNTIDSYYEYELSLTRQTLPETQTEFDNIPDTNPLKEYLRDFKIRPRELPNGETANVRWYQFRVPVDDPLATAIGGISDLRSVSFSRIYLKEFTEATVFRFGTLELVRSDWRRYTLPLDVNDPDSSDPQTEFSVGVIGTLENEGSYLSPPGIYPERVYHNNTIVDENEQALVVNVCNLEPEDARGVYKNLNLDMRQYKQMQMFIHAEDQDQNTGNLADNDLVGFVRLGNDLIDNFYQVEVPLQVTTNNHTREGVWPTANNIDIPISVFGDIKAQGISDMTLTNELPTYYDLIDGNIVPVADPNSGYVAGQQRVAVKGNPNYGDIRTIMLGVKNIKTGQEVCAEVWFNELRMSDMDSEGGWATILSMDANFADFANVSATGSQSTSGFGALEQGPSQRSLEEVQEYGVVTNVNIGQLLPKKWGIQIPFNYGQGAALITPKYDQFYEDLTLESRLEAANTEAEKEAIRQQSEDYTERQSINFIGVRKVRTTDAKPRFYDVENFTLNSSYNKIEHRDFEIENSLNQTLRLGANYVHNFNPLVVEPFKKNDSLFIGKYWKILKDFNVNFMPASFTVNGDINRQYTQQKFREVDLTGDNIAIEELYRRNYTTDFQYTINYNLTKSLQFNFTAANNNIVQNYYKNDDLIAGEQDPDLDIWDGMLDFGDPNRQFQSLGVTYQVPLNKIPTLSFLDLTYQYTGTFQWDKGSDLFENIELNGQVYDLGNTVQNSNTQNINSSMDMNRLYKYIGLTKKSKSRVRSRSGADESRSAGGPPGAKDDNKSTSKKKSKTGTNILNAGIDIITSVKRIQVNYSENKGTFLPGYLQTPGFIGTLKPTVGFTFGGQKDVTGLAAERGWLTTYPEFNELYTTTKTQQLDLTASLQPTRDLKIDILGNRAYYENNAENYKIENDEYFALTPNTFGSFSISTLLIKTAFETSDENTSAAFSDLRANRLVIADRLATEFYGTTNYARDSEGYPLGFGKNSQQVLLPSFLAAYQGKNAETITTEPFRNVPIPNWDIKYTGLMRFSWFKEKFKRFSLTSGYRSTYTINQYTTNLNLNQDPSANEAPIPGMPYVDQPEEALDQSGNYKNETLFTNINLAEMFSPLVRFDFEMKNSVRILAEIKKDRLLSLSFDNNLLTEVHGNEFVIGLGYRIKDLRIRSNLAGPQKRIISDLNMKADVSVRENETIVRYLDLNNNQITSGQTIWGVKYTTDYNFSKNLTGIFYFDYTFSNYAISTAFPQTAIRTGITIRYNFGN